MKTTFPNNQSAQRDWVIVDAAGKSLGRLASQVAKLLRGKHKPSYSPHTDMGDFVVVINAAAVVLTGNKEHAKLYHRHTGYPGGIRTTKASEMRQKHPERLIEKAVRGMLPKNALGNRLYTKLKVYADANHKHAAQSPKLIDETVQAI